MPTTQWAPIDEGAGLYTIEKSAASGWCWRATALRLEGGELLVVGPIMGTAEACAASLEAIGTPAFVLAPNHYHHMGIPELRARHPDLRCVASGVAARRLERERLHAFEPLDVLRAHLPSHASLLEPPGTKNGEAWLRVETQRGVAWVVSDAFFHVEKPVRGALGLALRATGTAPGLRIGSTFLWLALRDRSAYRRWLAAQLDADAPNVLVPGHGALITDPSLPARLGELAASRL